MKSIPKVLDAPPANWAHSCLGEIAHLANGSAFKPEDWDNSGVPIVRIQNLKNKNAPFNYFKGDVNTKVKLAHGDLLFSWSGSKGTSFGPHIWRGGPALLNQHIFRVDLRPNAKVSKAFLYFALLHLTKKIEDHAYGLAALVHVRKGDLEATLIPIPPPREQLQISGLLTLVQRAVEQHEQLMELTAELKKAVLCHLLTKGFRKQRQKATEIGPVPRSWKVVPFHSFATLQRGYDLPKHRFKGGPIPVIGASTTIGFHDEWNVRGPGVTVVRSGSSAGKPQYVKKDFWAHNVVLFVKDFHGNVPKFVFYKIQHIDLTKYREGVAVPTLNRNSFRNIPVAVPDYAEQQEFIGILDALEGKESVLMSRHRTLSDLFRSLLHQLMTAELRAPDLNLGDAPSFAAE